MSTAPRHAALRAVVTAAVVLGFGVPIALEGLRRLAAVAALALTVGATSGAAAWIERRTAEGCSRLPALGASLAAALLMSTGLVVGALQAEYAVTLLETADPTRAGAEVLGGAERLGRFVVPSSVAMALGQAAASLALLKRRVSIFLAFGCACVGVALVGSAVEKDVLVEAGSSGFVGATVLGLAALTATTIERWWWGPSDEESRDV